MKEIPLTRGKVALVDDEDYDYLMQWRWVAHKEKRGYYAVRTEAIPEKKTIIMHRDIMKTPPEMQVDHIDHNGLNNQKGNLRNCTHGQNQMNRTATGKSKYLGVSIDGGRIRSQITINRKTVKLGSFKTEEEAALAYNMAALLYHGEYANLNIISLSTP